MKKVYESTKAARAAYEARNSGRKSKDMLSISVGAELKARYLAEKAKTSGTHGEFLSVLLDCYASKI